MTPEAGRYLDKARRCLNDARASLGYGLTNDAGRGAYLAAFHAAQAFIFETTGTVAKTHQGVHSTFHRLALDAPRLDKAWPPFLTQAYNLKAVADYETGEDSDISPERAAAALETTLLVVEGIAGLLGETP